MNDVERAIPDTFKISEALVNNNELRKLTIRAAKNLKYFPELIDYIRMNCKDLMNELNAVPEELALLLIDFVKPVIGEE